MGSFSLGGLVASWYAASVLAIATCKHVLLVAHCPASLCAVQLACAAAGVRLTSRWQLSSKRHSAFAGSIAPLAKPEFNTVFAIAASYSLGFLLTNAAIAFAAPSFVETIKSGEPLSTVALAAVFIGERERWLTLACLMPIVLGVCMASGFGGSDHFSPLGCVLALASNVSFSSRAVLSKALRRAHPEAAASRSDAVLFYHVSRLGLYVAVPAALLLDAKWLIAALLSSGGDVVSGSEGGPTGSMGSSSNGSSSGGGSSGGGSIDGGGDTRRLLVLLLCNGAMHATYNGVSFSVLHRVSVATHSVLNIVRRVALIGVTAILFGTPISAFNAAGVALCVLGCVGFAQSKQGRVVPAATNGGSGAAGGGSSGGEQELSLPLWRPQSD